MIRENTQYNYEAKCDVIKQNESEVKKINFLFRLILLDHITNEYKYGIWNWYINWPIRSLTSIVIIQSLNTLNSIEKCFHRKHNTIK